MEASNNLVKINLVSFFHNQHNVLMARGIDDNLKEWTMVVGSRLEKEMIISASGWHQFANAKHTG